jgi:hypothetical protein
MSKNAIVYRLCCYLFVVCPLLLFAGCAADRSTSTQVDLPIISNVVDNNADIELPSDMKWDSEKSMAIKTDSFRGGINQYNGRVEINSLKDFIIASMKKHQWKHVGEASYKNILLAFTKPNKSCMVVISEDSYFLGDTHATLYFTVDTAGSKSVNAFGEPVK